MIEAKLNRLKEVIRSYESVLVAFSGGIDSTFVLKVAREVLGKQRAKAVTAKSESVAERELAEALDLARELDVEHRLIETQELSNSSYAANPANRCYFCKTELYDQLLPIAQLWNLKTIVNGTNVDDLGDWRPGLKAAEEHQVKSPLVEAGIGKQDIRTLALQLNVRIWDKPASPCLSSRIPYGEAVTPEKLKQIETGENFLKDLGLRIVRLRHFGKKARLELGRDEFIRLMDAGLRQQVSEFICSLGFKTVIFERYQQGRLNEEARIHESA